MYELQLTSREFQRDPDAIEGGELSMRAEPVAQRVTSELSKQCTACGQRFDCSAYIGHLAVGRPGLHPDVDLLNVAKN